MRALVLVLANACGCGMNETSYLSWTFGLGTLIALPRLQTLKFSAAVPADILHTVERLTRYVPVSYCVYLSDVRIGCSPQSPSRLRKRVPRYCGWVALLLCGGWRSASELSRVVAALGRSVLG